jgi:hypothetical protein
VTPSVDFLSESLPSINVIIISYSVKLFHVWRRQLSEIQLPDTCRVYQIEVGIPVMLLFGNSHKWVETLSWMKGREEALMLEVTLLKYLWWVSNHWEY